MVELKVRERLLLLYGLRCVLSWTGNHDHSRHEHTDFSQYRKVLYCVAFQKIQSKSETVQLHL